MKTIYPNSASLRSINCLFSWELGAVGVEYLFMGDGSYNFEQITEANYDFISISIDGLNAKPQLDIRSGRYRQRDAVPK